MPPTRVGLLGGGQLARMLALAGAPLGFQVSVLSPKADDPAAQVTSHWQSGDPQSSTDLSKFMAGLDALSFESEFFNMELVQQALDQHPQVYVYPRPDLMARIQDRRQQKALMAEFKLPTSEWISVDRFEDLSVASQKLGFPFVLKQAQGGYDGYGTFYLKNAAEFENLKNKSVFPAIAEKVVNFKRELAIMAFRSRSGDTVIYPLVESRQTDSRCDWVLGPMKHKSLSLLLQKIKKALTRLDYVGALGIELFDTGKELVVNELAPRVHNTGHFSQNAMNYDQFQLHLLCARNAALPKIEMRTKAFVMANLLGQDDQALNLSAKLTGALHWYGKSESRLGRKMGHINYWGQDLQTLLRTARRERSGFFKKTLK